MNRPQPKFERVSEGVTVIDTDYVRPRMDASYLITDGGRAAFVDTGTAHSVPNLLSTLAAQDLDVDCVDYILLTHVHLDHAGGVGPLAAALPRARVLVHPRGAPHMIDPSILAAATQAVYGEERFAEVYGHVAGVTAERVEAIQDGHRVSLGHRTLEFFHTPGHALHHLCIADLDSAEVFVGDTFGLSYREFDTAAGEFILPTTSPSQFDPVQLHASIDRIVGYKPRCAYLTHFGRVSAVEALAANLHEDIDAFVRIAQRVTEGPERAWRMESMLFDYLSERLATHGFSGDAGRQHDLLDLDIELNAAGLDIWLARRKA